MKKTDKRWRAISHLNHVFLVSPDDRAYLRFNICVAAAEANANNALEEVERLAEEGKL